ncbi:hypothetical protein QP968_01735 [Corynebacterium sp. MSK041]|uniref:hypothetical protein n=1 Tax=Corynebacterium sp. MSK041 TaxID=3050194 RepID=UPI00255146F0|nr:hypothetical protein [Corynebacterium sp. MSK041]MDK8794437.1 hypothetical protein [Corynebacterium sp. MSK041]
MRKFRNAALAAATATAVAFGGVTVAGAEEAKETAPSAFVSGSSTKNPNNTEIKDVLKQGFDGMSSGKGFSGFGHATDADKPAFLTFLFGKEKKDGETPQWALMWRDAIDWFALLAGLGALIGLGNWALHEGLLPQL